MSKQSTYGATRAVRKNAGNLLAYAVRAGKIAKPEHCDGCGQRVEVASDLHAHHFDYDSPRDVRWLCSKCHRKLHRQQQEAAMADRFAGLSG